MDTDYSIITGSSPHVGGQCYFMYMYYIVLTLKSLKSLNEE